jgi:hypothetical protein
LYSEEFVGYRGDTIVGVAEAVVWEVPWDKDRVVWGTEARSWYSVQWWREWV